MSIKSDSFRAAATSILNALLSRLDANKDDKSAATRVKAIRKLLSAPDSALSLVTADPMIVCANVKAIDRTADLLLNVAGMKRNNANLFRAVLSAVGSSSVDHPTLVRRVAASLGYTAATAQARTFNAVSALRFCGVIECSESDTWTHYDKSCAWTIRDTVASHKIRDALRG